MLIYDPTIESKMQNSNGGEYVGKSFYFRFLSSPKSLSRSIFIPYGPMIIDESGFAEFDEFLKSQHLRKIQIDLPLIVDEKAKEKLIAILQKHKFKPTKYKTDAKTILLTPETYKTDTPTKNYAKKAQNIFKIENKSSLSDSEINEIYALYLEHSKNLGFRPRSIEIFKRFQLDTNTTIARNEQGELCGFVFGMTQQFRYLENFVAYKITYHLFTSVNNFGRENHLGFLMNINWIENSFANRIQFIDLHGADDHQPYTIFKLKFCAKNQKIAHIDLPGSFVKSFI